jgi:hypothetical protein
MSRKHYPGGSVKAEGLGDGPAYRKIPIATLRLTLPPTMGVTLRLPWGIHTASGCYAPEERRTPSRETPKREGPAQGRGLVILVPWCWP